MWFCVHTQIRAAFATALMRRLSVYAGEGKTSHSEGWTCNAPVAQLRKWFFGDMFAAWPQSSMRRLKRVRGRRCPSWLGLPELIELVRGVRAPDAVHGKCAVLHKSASMWGGEQLEDLAMPNAADALFFLWLAGEKVSVRRLCFCLRP